MRSAFSRAGNFLLSSGRAMATGIGQMAANAWGRLGGFAAGRQSVMNGLSARAALSPRARRGVLVAGTRAASVGERPARH